MLDRLLLDPLLRVEGSSFRSSLFFQPVCVRACVRAYVTIFISYDTTTWEYDWITRALYVPDAVVLYYILYTDRSQNK